MPGLYRYRYGKQCHWVPARIDVIVPTDPETGEELDRAHRLRCLVAGEEVDPWSVWPMWPIERGEYLRLMDAMPDDPRTPKDMPSNVVEINFAAVDLNTLRAHIDKRAIEAAIMSWARDASPKQREELRGVRWIGGEE